MSSESIALLRAQVKSQTTLLSALAAQHVDLQRKANKLFQELSSINSEIALLDAKGRIAALELEKLELSLSKAHDVSLKGEL
jgi:hypothetical protein